MTDRDSAVNGSRFWWRFFWWSGDRQMWENGRRVMCRSAHNFD